MEATLFPDPTSSLVSPVYRELPLRDFPDAPPGPPGAQSYVLWTGLKGEYVYQQGDIRVWQISFRFSSDGTGLFAAMVNSVDSGDELRMAAFALSESGDLLYRIPPKPEGFQERWILYKDIPEAPSEKYIAWAYSYPKQLFPHVRRVGLRSEG